MIYSIFVQSLIHKAYARLPSDINTGLSPEEKFKDLGTIGGGEGFGPWAEKALSEKNPGIILANILSNVLGVMTIFAGIWFLFQAIIAGYGYMSAGGDKEKIQTAGRKLTNAIIGIAVVAAAYGLLALLSSFVGIKFLDIGSAINLLTPGK